MVDVPSRILQSPKVGLGVTTAALVALATAGTSLLVSHGTRDLQPPSPVAAAPQPAGPPRSPVVVDRAPGSIVLPPAHLGVTRPTAQQPVSTVPGVPAPPVAPPAPQVPPVGPVLPPVPPQPPVVQPPVVEPPVVPPPVVDPDVIPGHGHRAHPAHPDDNGKHLGQLKR